MVLQHDRVESHRGDNQERQRETLRLHNEYANQTREEWEANTRGANQILKIHKLHCHDSREVKRATPPCLVVMELGGERKHNWAVQKKHRLGEQ